jgi:hypothetical protein
MASGTSNALSQTQAAATITQSNVVFVTPFGNVSLSAGTVLATGASTSAN